MNQALPLTEQSVQTASALAIAQAIVLKYASYIQCGLGPDEALGPTASASMQTTKRKGQ
jgi:hypothetical protein